MNLSYWEYKSWFSNIDFTIVGSGIVGLNCALALREKYPKTKILILEKGSLPQGASTKNAGFACFGSISEILTDLNHHTEEETVHLVAKRVQGIALLRKSLGDRAIDFQQHGGHELFAKKDLNNYEECLGQLSSVNKLLRPVFGADPFKTHENNFGFQQIQEKYITQVFEGQIDTGKMMSSLLRKAQKKDIIILNATAVEDFNEGTDHVEVKTKTIEFKTKQLFIATNGFASQFIGSSVQPARAQVLITKPIQKLHIKGTFHIDEGYYYFRNINNRILFGGGRNLDLKGEHTTTFGLTKTIQGQLEMMLREIILADVDFEIEQRWSGIMGVGQQKKPIVRQLSNRVYCGVRLGGMGIAIGSIVGQDLACLA